MWYYWTCERIGWLACSKTAADVWAGYGVAVRFVAGCSAPKLRQLPA